jgi:hypothetical protein
MKKHSAEFKAKIALEVDLSRRKTSFGNPRRFIAGSTPYYLAPISSINLDRLTPSGISIG